MKSIAQNKTKKNTKKCTQNTSVNDHNPQQQLIRKQSGLI